MYISPVYPFHVEGHLYCFHCFAIIGSIAIKSLCNSVLICENFSRIYSRNVIKGSKDGYILKFLPDNVKLLSMNNCNYGLQLYLADGLSTLLRVESI